MFAPRRPVDSLGFVAAGLAALALVAFTLSVMRWISTAQAQNSTASSGTPVELVPIGATSPQIETSGSDLTSTNFPDSPSSAPSSPTDAWATVVLDRFTAELGSAPPPSDGLGWWQGSGASGPLSVGDSGIALRGSRLSIPSGLPVDIMMPDPVEANRLVRIASIRTDADAMLVLNVSAASSDIGDTRWLLNGYSVEHCLAALVYQARQRGLQLLAAYIHEPGDPGQIALVDAAPLISSTVTPTRPFASETAVSAVTIAPSVTVTPTRAPDTYIGRFLAERIDPFISQIYDPSRVFELAKGHPRNGFATWSETGPLVNGQPLPILAARELDFFAVTPPSVPEPTTLILEAVYLPDEDITRLQGEGLFLPGHRMDELLYWIVRRAAERGGQLQVIYDDYGNKQVITFIGFRRFETVN